MIIIGKAYWTIHRLLLLRLTTQDPNKTQRNANAQTDDSKKPIVLIDDSVIKNIDPKRLSKKQVRKFTYPGKTADQIK